MTRNEEPMADKKFKWTIEVWVPHAKRTIDDAFTYEVDTEDVTHMGPLCEQALKDFDAKHPEYAGKGQIMGTLAHDQVFEDDDLLANHPEHLTHHCDGECNRPKNIVAPEPDPPNPIPIHHRDGSRKPTPPETFT